MNKLGFAIKFASQGAGNAIECNKGQWTNKVVDIREYLKLFNGLQGTDNIVTFMSFDEGGCFLTQLRAISGRGGDFLSGWIYIPNTIEASGEDVMKTYNYVRNILSKSNLNDYISDIESFFSKEYPKKEYAASYVPSSGEEFGVRFIDIYYSMKEILDTDRYQPYYSKYKAIFLLDKDGEVKISKEKVARFKDFTKLKIDKICIFKAPSPEEVRLLGRGTKIVFQNDQEFKSPVLTKKGDKVQLYAIRDGFERVALPLVMIQEDGQVMSIDPQTVKWRKRIKPSMFVVTNRKHEPIEKGVRISINGTDVTYQEALIAEEDCRQALVKVSASDYETYEQKQNLLNGNCEIVLNRKVKSFQATVELANGKLAEMTIESKYLPSTHKSPLKGYDYDQDYHGKSILKMKSWFVWQQRLWGFLGGLGVLALIVLSLMIDTWIDNGYPMPWDEKKEQPTEATTTGETDEQGSQVTENDSASATKPYTLEDALKYLDEKEVWIKSEMEQYPDLQGLFEDMNTFNLSRLLNEWQSKLSSSKRFKKVCESAKKTYTKGWIPKQGSHNPTWNQPNDERINLENYINWLDRDQTPPATNTGGGFHPGTGAGKSGANAGKSGSNAGKGTGGSNPGTGAGKSGANAGKSGSNAGKGTGSSNPGKSRQGNNGKDIFD